MARYIGPKTKISRKFGESIFGPDKSFEKKNYPPGQHGLNKRRQKKSEYAIQLMEKQKAKFLYGILEKQFRNLFEKANRSKGITGEVLLQLCESRLDNVVYRMGISKTNRVDNSFFQMTYRVRILTVQTFLIFLFLVLCILP
jgi:small subunit ribosomal protein S4